MRRLRFTSVALEDLKEWKKSDQKIFRKIMGMIEEIRVTPKTGTGKPEPLKYEWSGYWSRRITKEHRLVYRFDEEIVTIA